MSTQTLVLDLNIIESATSGKNIDGIDDEKCKELLRIIVHKCHKLIMTKKIEEKYRLKIMELARGDVMMHGFIINFLTEYCYQNGKIEKLEDNQTPISGLDDCKSKFVHAANDGSAILVTQNTNLISIIENNETLVNLRILPLDQLVILLNQ